jgi:DNA-binding transcriptional MerR regulator
MIHSVACPFRFSMPTDQENQIACNYFSREAAKIVKMNPVTIKREQAMPYHRLSTAKIARLVGVHPNTVRMYEEWGFLPPVPRAANGYRLYTSAHLDQMRLARRALSGDWPGRAIRRSALGLVRQAASGDLSGALEAACRHQALVRSELAHAENAVRLVERWAQGYAIDPSSPALKIGEAAALLQVTCDALRNWERNGLIAVPRSLQNQYRLYSGGELGRLRVIRALRSAGYSLMAILRMLSELDADQGADVRYLLDTPRPDEDIRYATDHWLSTLTAQETTAAEIIRLLEDMVEKRA